MRFAVIFPDSAEGQQLGALECDEAARKVALRLRRLELIHRLEQRAQQRLLDASCAEHRRGDAVDARVEVVKADVDGIEGVLRGNLVHEAAALVVENGHVVAVPADGPAHVQHDLLPERQEGAELARDDLGGVEVARVHADDAVFAKRGVEIDTNFQYTVQKPTMHRARDISGVLLDQFEKGELDEIYIVYTRMENSVQSEAEVIKLLPLERSSFNEMTMPLNVHRESIELYPSAEAVMDSIVPNYVTGMIYGCLVEAYASEHNARMMAMKSATDSAQSLIHDLSILYNRARQAAITQEITEVCAGARAQQK